MSSSYNALEEEGGGGVEEYATECEILNFVKMKELIPKSFLVESKVATPLAIMYIDICIYATSSFWNFEIHH